MTVRGHDTEWDEARRCHVFVEDGTLVDMSIPFGGGKPCAACGDHPTPEGHDACIADLPGVRFACCGHGRAEAVPYVSFVDGSSLNHQAALDWFAAQNRDVPPAGQAWEWDEIDAREGAKLG